MRKIIGNERFLTIVVPILSALFGLAVGAIVMGISGYDPVQGYSALLEGIIGTPRALGETIRSAIPLILTGLAVAFAFRTGLFNIGVEGQVLVGWLAAVWVGITFDLPAIIHVPFAIFAAWVAGALWGFIPGFLKGMYRVNEVIISIMLNYIALYGTYYIIKEFMHAGNEKTEMIHESASLSSSFLASVTMNSRLHWGFIIAALAVGVMAFILSRTTLGYELKSVGFNQHAAEYAGMNVKRNVILSMSIAGGFAGLAGAMEGLGTHGYMTAVTSFTNLGFDGIAVALLGMNNPFGIVLSALLFGGLKSGSAQMSFDANVPAEVIHIIIACIIFFVACSYLIKWCLLRVAKEKK